MTHQYADQACESKCFWRDLAESCGLPVFPIRVDWNPQAQKWIKRPLTKHGHLDASLDVSRFDWSRANGYGLRTGNGIYAFDVDVGRPGGIQAAKEWLIKRNLRDRPTRIHKTVSGGWHLIFTLPEQYWNLPSRNGIVPALDSRGDGGWIAMAQGYEVYDDSPPAPLPVAVCEEILAGHSGGAGSGPQSVALFDYVPPDPGRIALQWEVAQWSMRLLRHRALGTKTHGDTSRSAADHSVAFCLAIANWTEHQIVYALMNLFEHGACRDPAKPEGARLRAAMRCAAKAIAHREAHLAALRPDSFPAISEADEAAYVASLSGESTA